MIVPNYVPTSARTTPFRPRSRAVVRRGGAGSQLSDIALPDASSPPNSDLGLVVITGPDGGRVDHALPAVRRRRRQEYGTYHIASWADRRADRADLSNVFIGDRRATRPEYRLLGRDTGSQFYLP